MKFKLLVIAFLMVVSCGYADSDFNKVSQVKCPSSLMCIEEVTVSDEITTIVLDNKTVWTCKYTNLFNEPNSWCIGDRVHIVYVYSAGYYLQNASYQGCVPVRLQNKNSNDLKVNVIKEIIRNEKKLTTTIVMNDETTWLIGTWSSGWMKDWEVGDRIVVTEQEFFLGKADHLLLNLDRGRKIPENVRAQLLTTTQIINFEDLNKRQARTWENSIASIWQQSHSFIIELNNQTLWKCSNSKSDWKIGDKLEFDFLEEKCELVNLENSERTQAVLINNSQEKMDLPFIKKITRRGIELSDDSVWFFGSRAFKNWKAGDRIVVSAISEVELDTSTHLLINIDAAVKVADQYNYASATLVK